MITIHLMGGLGNQLFQLFTALSYSKRYNKPLFISMKKNDIVSPIDNISPRPTYWKSFLSNFKQYIIIDNAELSKHINVAFKDGEVYEEIPYTQKNIILIGYFQSYKYFEDIRNELPALLQLNQYKNIVIQKYSFSNKIYISLHFRIGDYKQAGPDNHPILPLKYYIDSIQYIINQLQICQSKKVCVLCFGEKSDLWYIQNQMTFLSVNFPQIYFEYCQTTSPLTDYEELVLMSCCNHNIIANSTFSWWAAYLNTHVDHITTYPSIWFGKNIKKNVTDMFPTDWKCIS